MKNRTGLFVFALIVSVAAGCGSAPSDNGNATSEESDLRRTSLPYCPGAPPRATTCERVFCDAKEGAWTSTPLDPGALCNGMGRCDGRGTCQIPPDPSSCGAVDPSCSLGTAQLTDDQEATRVALGCEPAFLWTSGADSGVRVATLSRCPDTREVRDYFAFGYPWTFCDACLAPPGYGHFYTFWSNIIDPRPNCPSGCSKATPPDSI